MSRHPELARFLLEHAITLGEFRLVSGQTSSYYCDGKLASFHPVGIALIADAILKEVEDVQFDAIGGMDMGATPIVSAVALRSGQVGTPVPTFIVRKQAKVHGTMKRIEGCLPEEPSRVVIVDDVITTGGSIIKAIHEARAAGHEVVLAMCVLDRESGAEETLGEEGVPYCPLVRVSELGIEPAGGPRGGGDQP